MTINIKELITKLNAVCAAHNQINSYYHGDVVEILKSKEIIYTTVITTSVSAVINPTDVTLTLQVMVLDKMLKDKQNYLEVESNTLLVLSDIVNFIQGNNDVFKYARILGSPNATKIEDKAFDVVDGWSVNFQMKLSKPNGTCVGPVQIVCADATYIIRYEDGTPIASGTIPSGGSEIIEVPDCPSADPVTYEILDSASNVLYSGSVAAGGNLSQAINDSIATLKDADGNVLSTINLLAEGTADIIAPDSSITVNGNAFGNALSGGLFNVPVQYQNTTPVGTIMGGVVEIPDPITCADATVENSDQSYSDTVASGGTLVLPDTSYDVYLNGNLKSSFSLITLKNDNINITIN